MISLISLRPYLLRAFYNWLLDNHLTPYILVNSNMPNVQVPLEHERGGQIILNISPTAIHSFNLTNDKVCFNARFNGLLRHVSLPILAIVSIYSCENGIGIIFEPEIFVNNPQSKNIKNKNKFINTIESINGNFSQNIKKDDDTSLTIKPLQSNKRTILRLVK
ncbi:ClpXP protease specificity-enhancing factor [Pantoea sp. Aalb]|uniref:ClpXP protease specificity-enhancing factor n=1 Tax=Pantoea sp. Aalb TaxID=2576762 RepID=UPI0013291414|nr:ClpXP protease specificity-enhancing factor [Pantoea sp. Aalb]MXP67811.1 ClpXP protease specificity-enhancing factor [Pantoea sp. Aalb]